MTKINKEKIRVDCYKEFEDVFNFTSNKLTSEEFQTFIGEQVKEKVQEILFGTGEQHIYIESLVLRVNCIEDYNRDNSFDIKVRSEIVYLELETEVQYKDRMFKLKKEEAQLKELATKFGYKLEKLDE